MGAGSREQGAGSRGEIAVSFSPLPPAPRPSASFQCPMPHNLIILYISTWKSCPLQLKIKMRAVDKTLIST